MLSRKQTRGGSGKLPPPHQNMNKEQEKDMKNQDDRVALFRLNTEEGRREYAARFTRVIRQSEADGCFIGSLPEVDGWCTHAESAEECQKEFVFHSHWTFYLFIRKEQEENEIVRRRVPVLCR